jgi:hypothetical protein
LSLVFDDIARDLAGPMAADETQFGYLNRSNRDEAEKVRELIEAWLEAYPAEHRKSLVGRLRSQTDEEHVSAVFELLLHALLLWTGHTIVAIEPELGHTPNRPDFLVAAPDGAQFYLEAVTVTGKSKAEVGQERLLSTAVRAIERAAAPNHFLDLHKQGKPNSPISGKKLRRLLAAWIGGLPEGEAAKDVAPFVYAEHGVTFTVRAFPRLKPAEPGDNPIGISSGEAVWIAPGRDVRGSLEHKASRYGDLDLPFVVAVNVLGHNAEDHLADALFGSPIAVARPLSDGQVEWVMDRERDGVWRGPRGARKTGLSAVLAFSRLDAWNFAGRPVRLWRNPWGSRPLADLPLGVPQFNPIEGNMVEVEGESLQAILGLPHGWPEA